MIILLNPMLLDGKYSRKAENAIEIWAIDAPVSAMVELCAILRPSAVRRAKH
jgi:hypothetical protein